MANLVKKSGRNSRKLSIRKEDKLLSDKEEEILEYIGKKFEKNQEESIKRLELAEILQCSPALINKLLISLEKKGLIHHKKYGEIKFTRKGKIISTNLIRKHRLSEALFVELLGLDSSDAHEFACKFEHIMDDTIANRIEELLKKPAYCPHGNPIPSKNKQKILRKGLPLSSFSVNETVYISQIVLENTNFLKQLSRIGIEVGSKIKILEKSPVDGTLLLNIHGKNTSLGVEAAKNLMAVRKEGGEE